MFQATLSGFNTHEKYARRSRTHTHTHNNVKQYRGQTNIHLERFHLIYARTAEHVLINFHCFYVFGVRRIFNYSKCFLPRFDVYISYTRAKLNQIQPNKCFKRFAVYIHVLIRICEFSFRFFPFFLSSSSPFSSSSAASFSVYLCFQVLVRNRIQVILSVFKVKTNLTFIG